MISNLAEIVVSTEDSADQSMDNIQIISAVIFETASLLDSFVGNQSVEPEVLESVSYMYHMQTFNVHPYS